MRFGGKNWPRKNCNPAHWAVLENMKEGINIFYFNCIFKGFIADKDLPHNRSPFNK